MTAATSELLVVGCSHRTAPPAVRESLAFSPQQVLEALRLARGDGVLREALILSTCHRTEFYALSQDPARAEVYVREMVARFKGRDLLGKGPFAYTYRDWEMVRHLLSVAAGLDSIMIGEIQILGQVKEAYKLACEGGSAGLFLNRLLSAALRTGKRARTETEIGAGPVSFASAAVAVAAKIFSSLAERRVLVLGAGETGRLAAQHFAEEKPAALMIANRTADRAASLALDVKGEAVPFDDLFPSLARADIVVSATRHQGFLISEAMVRRAMRERSGRPMAFVDLAVPRDIDPAIARMDNVFLYPLESLQTIMEQNLARRRKEIPGVEKIVEEETDRFFRWVRSLEVTPVVRELRERFEAVRTEELRKHLHQVPESARGPVEALTRSLVNKLLHQPTVRIKTLDLDSQDGLIRLDVVRELFDLKGDTTAGDALEDSRSEKPTSGGGHAS